MNTFTTALKGEYIKKKGTGLYWVAAIMGFFMPFVYALAMVLDTNVPRNADAIPYNYYQDIIEEMLTGYGSFFLPLLIIISVSRITQLDHRNGGWQLMETQPVHKRHFYFAKLALVLTASMLSIVALILSCYLFGSLMLLLTDVPKDAVVAFEAGPVLMVIFRLFVASLFITAVQYIVSVLIPSFIWSILIGFFLLLSYLFLSAFDVVPNWYPMDILGKIGKFPKGSELGYWATYAEAVSALLAVATLYVGFNWYKHKGFKRAFLTPSRGGALVAVLAVFVGLAAWLLVPKQYDGYNKTIIAGHIESKEKFNVLYVTDNFVHDTVAKIPVVNNKFHFEIKKDIPLDNYAFTTNGTLRGFVFFGSKDSVYIAIQKNNQVVDGKITGTRLAENKYKKQENNTYSLTSYYLDQNEIGNAGRFTDVLVEEWQGEINRTDKFRSADNYVPREDFMEYNKKSLTLIYLNHWQNFVKKRKVLYPGQPTPETPEILAMKKSVPTEDEGLLSDYAYFSYIKSELLAKNNDDIDENTKALLAINKMKPGAFKDKMLFWQLKASLEQASAPSERETLLAQYTGSFSNTGFASRIGNYNKTLRNLDKGQPAPAIAASTLDKKPFGLEQHKGKLIAIDVWATWCGPCREQSPKFEKIAIKYKDQPITFVALSTDRNETEWFIEAKLKSKSVLQVRANDSQAFGKDYNIEFIPRFILIGKDGKLINANMPQPADKAFEDIIRRELALPEEK